MIRWAYIALQIYIELRIIPGVYKIIIAKDKNNGLNWRCLRANLVCGLLYQWGALKIRADE